MAITTQRIGVPGKPPLVFNIPLLKKQVVSKSWCPSEGKSVAALDTSFGGTGKRCDDSAMAAGIIQPAYDGTEPHTIPEPSRLWVRHIEYGKFSARELPTEITTFLKKWTTDQSETVIEKINGLLFLQVLIEDRLALLKMTRKIRWISPPKVKDSKVTRVNHLIGLSLAGRLRLCACESVYRMIDQAETWTGEGGKNRGRKDDLLDAVSLMAWHFIK